MKSRQSLKVLTAGVVLATGLFTALPTNGSAMAAWESQHNLVPDSKKGEIKTFEELKQLAIDLYNSPRFQPDMIVVRAKKDFDSQFMDYVLSSDISQDIPGYTFWGRKVQIWTEEVRKGLYEYTVEVVYDRDEQEEIAWNKKMDAAEKYIVANYKLDTDYDVVFAINEFIADNLEYGARIADDHPYLEWRGNASTCTGYADLATTLYARFGIVSRTVSGVSKQGAGHAWNVVKIGGNWYHSDSQLYGYGHGYSRNVKYLLMTESEKTSTTSGTNFKATDVKFEMSMAKPYSYQEVKKAQAKKK